MTPIQQLAKELKEAAEKYTAATGQRFEADFVFVGQNVIQSTTLDYYCTGVIVKSTQEEKA